MTYDAGSAAPSPMPSVKRTPTDVEVRDKAPTTPGSRSVEPWKSSAPAIMDGPVSQYGAACCAPVDRTAWARPAFWTAETGSSPVGPTIRKLDGSRALPAGGRSNVTSTRCWLTALTAVTRADPPPSPRASSSLSNQLACEGAAGSNPTSTTVARTKDTPRRHPRTGVFPRRDPPTTFPPRLHRTVPQAPIERPTRSLGDPTHRAITDASDC